MEKYDGAGMDAADEFVEGFFPAWLCVLLPVDVCQAPEDGGVPSLAGQIQALDAVFALGRAKIRVQRPAGDLLVSGGDAVQFFFKPGGIGDGGHVRVVFGVVPGGVAFVCDPFCQVRGGAKEVSGEEKGGGYVLFF